MVNQNNIHCPKCNSTQLFFDKKGFSGTKALVGGLLTGGIGLLAGLHGKNDIIITCINCNNKFTPKDLIELESQKKENEALIEKYKIEEKKRLWEEEKENLRIAYQTPEERKAIELEQLDNTNNKLILLIVIFSIGFLTLLVNKNWFWSVILFLFIILLANFIRKNKIKMKNKISSIDNE